MVAWAEACGVYTLLDLQWIDAETPRGIGQDGSINRVPALPDADSIELWRILASRYRDRPSVLFDLFNEPHTPMQTDDAPLVGVRPDGGLWRLPARVVGMDEWQPWALRLIAEIRAAHPAAVIFVSGVRWAYDLRGFPLRRRSGHAVEGLVYSTHVYPWTTIGLLAGPPAEQRVAPGLRPPGGGVSGLRGGVGRRTRPTSTGAAGCSPISRRRRWAGRRGAGATGRRCWPTIAAATARRRRSETW